jgi:uncharacterized protein
MIFRYFIFVLIIFTFACNPAKEPNTQTASSMKTSNMEVKVIRLRPEQDLKKELEKFVTENRIQAGVLLSCVGSLQMTNLRFANQPKGTAFEGKQEIVSLVGTLGLSGSHLHLSIADSTGKTIGGHLLEGCLIYTTAEIAIGILPQLRFERELDSLSTYKELSIYKR